MRVIRFLSCCALFVLLIRPVISQQPNLAEQTLNFTNITQTNVNQTVPENQNLNEKDIDFADFDNDGDLDCVVAVSRSDFGQRKNKLYRNDNGILNEVSGMPVIPGFGLDDNAKAAFFRDFDLDGFADLVIVCNSNSGTFSNEAPGTTKYFRNIDGIEFVNESERLGGLTGAASYGACADFDQNGTLDLVQFNEVNTAQDNMVFNGINGNASGLFQLVTNSNYPFEIRNADKGSAADMNGDGLVDILVGNSTNCFIYYNNNLGLGSGPGDFRYESPASESEFVSMGSASFNERGLYPGDFNNDGMMDFYFAERINNVNIRDDFVMKNVGNDELNRAIFEPIAMPESTSTRTMKVDVTDLDLDGRVDLIVMSELRQPQIFRNTSENGDISFLEWSPAVFDITHAGWHAVAADVLDNSRPEILVGALQDDFLFANETSPHFAEEELANNELPSFHLSNPISVTGEIEISEATILSSSDLPAGANVSVLLRSLGDLSLKISQGETVLAELDRPGHATDEAIQFAVPLDGPIDFEIGVEAISFDGNSDGVVNLLDVGEFIACLTGASQNCDPFDLNDDGVIELTSVQPFIDSVAEGRTSESFVIEFLSRD